MENTSGHVHLIDDDADVRLHLGDLIRLMGYSVTTYESAERFLGQTATTEGPEAILMDVRMKGISGVDAQRILVQLQRDTPIVFVSGESESQEIIDALKMGAVDFLLKPVRHAELAASLQRAMALDLSRRSLRDQIATINARLETLTPRERLVLSMLVMGYANREIGVQIGVAADTVKKHRAAILEKMGVNSTAELIQICAVLRP
jgi:FixJ family two-component response regulator